MAKQTSSQNYNLFHPLQESSMGLQKRKIKENRNWDIHNLGFDTSKTKEYLLSDCHMLGKMLRAPQDEECFGPPKAYLPFGICCSPLSNVAIQQLAQGGAKETASTLLKSQFNVRTLGKGKNKNETSEGSWVRLHFVRQNCRDLNAQYPLNTQI